MSKMPKTIYTCQNCGYQAAKWMGRCPDCGKWDSLLEETLSSAAAKGAICAETPMPVPIDAVAADDEERRLTGIAELDQILAMLDLEPVQMLLVALLFVWAGFVRSGLGFGGAALGLPLMPSYSSSRHETAFTVSIEAREGIDTGISAADRARTVQVFIDPSTRPDDLARPGHIFPLRAKPGGVLVRTGHTEAAVDLAGAVPSVAHGPPRLDSTSGGVRSGAARPCLGGARPGPAPPYSGRSSTGSRPWSCRQPSPASTTSPTPSRRPPTRQSLPEGCCSFAFSITCIYLY